MSFESLAKISRTTSAFWLYPASSSSAARARSPVNKSLPASSICFCPSVVRAIRSFSFSIAFWRSSPPNTTSVSVTALIASSCAFNPSSRAVSRGMSKSMVSVSSPNLRSSIRSFQSSR